MVSYIHGIISSPPQKFLGIPERQEADGRRQLGKVPLHTVANGDSSGAAPAEVSEKRKTRLRKELWATHQTC